MADNEEVEKEIPEIFLKIWKYHPLALLALSLGIAIFSYTLIPKQVVEPPKPLSFFYKRSLEALRKAMNPLLDPSKISSKSLSAGSAEDSEMAITVDYESAVQNDIQLAKTDLEYILTSQNYRLQIEQDPSLINPFLLYGESLYLYGINPNITQDRYETFQAAVSAYTSALNWEEHKRDERSQKIYEKQYFKNDEPYDEKILAARKLLRKQYIKYKLALSALGAKHYTLASEELEGLLQEFRLESLETASDKRNTLWQKLEGLTPHEFELLPEHRTLIYYHLAQLYESKNEIDNAEKYYRIFLLHAKRSKEYFHALMRLGEVYFKRAREAHESSDIPVARQLYGDATAIFSKVVAASPPGPVLREAYFIGGRAYFNMALTIPVDAETLWDKSAGVGEKIEESLRKFTFNNEIPERSIAAVGALGRLLSQNGANSADPLWMIGAGGGGVMLRMFTEDKLTPIGERKKLLRRAKMFFTGSQGGRLQRYDGAANVMLAKTYMFEGDFKKARGLLSHTSTKYYSTVELACNFGTAVSYLMEGDLDGAYVRFIGTPEKLDLSLLVEDDIKSWTGLCAKIYNESHTQEPNPSKRVWTLLPKKIQEIVHRATITGRFQERYKAILVRALNDICSSENFYDPKYFPDRNILPEMALMLLENDITLLNMRHRQWLNRMLLDSAYPTYILRTKEGKKFKPFPDEKVVSEAKGALLNAEMVMSSLQKLADAYVMLANKQLAEIAVEPAPKENAERRLIAAAPRRNLKNATNVFKFLVKNYTPYNKGDILMEIASIFKKRAQLAAMEPFVDFDLSRKLVSLAADEYMKIGKSGKYLNLEQEALLEAGRNYYAARQYGRASEALEVFVKNYSKSTRIGWASNLLGRCYWRLKRFTEAAKVFKENSHRRTPDGSASLYYLGEVLLDQGETPGENTQENLIGDPENPYAKGDDNGLPNPVNALQVFNEIRRKEGVTPSSRPWRWATFGLGKVWFDIAEKARAKEEAAAIAEDRKPAKINWVPYYENAEKILREGLDRYPLKYSESDELGKDVNLEPEDYYDIMRQRMENEYFLALVLRVLARDNVEMDESEARKHLEDVINLDLYPKRMLKIDADRLLLGNLSVLGITAGPIVRPVYMNGLRRHAFYLLAESWESLGREYGRMTPPNIEEKKKAYNKALQVYRLARDQLEIKDGPRILYNMGEVMVSLGKPEVAMRMFMMVINQVEQIAVAGNNEEIMQEINIWKTLAEQRLEDLRQNIQQ